MTASLTHPQQQRVLLAQESMQKLGTLTGDRRLLKAAALLGAVLADGLNADPGELALVSRTAAIYAAGILAYHDAPELGLALVRLADAPDIVANLEERIRAATAKGDGPTEAGLGSCP